MQAQQQIQMFNQGMSSNANVLTSGQPQHPLSQNPPSQHTPPTHWTLTAQIQPQPAPGPLVIPQGPFTTHIPATCKVISW